MGSAEAAGSKREEWSDFRAKSEQSARSVSSSTIGRGRNRLWSGSRFSTRGNSRAENARKARMVDESDQPSAQFFADLHDLSEPSAHVSMLAESDTTSKSGTTAHPHLQKRYAIIRLWSAFSAGQWLSCSPFAPIAHSSPENLTTLRAYYQQPANKARQRW
jgi:hypothetical protein